MRPPTTQRLAARFWKCCRSKAGRGPVPDLHGALQPKLRGMPKTATSNCPPIQQITTGGLWGGKDRLERVPHTQSTWGNGSHTSPPCCQRMEHHFPSIPLSELPCCSHPIGIAPCLHFSPYLSLAKAAGLSTTTLSRLSSRSSPNFAATLICQRGIFQGRRKTELLPICPFCSLCSRLLTAISLLFKALLSL